MSKLLDYHQNITEFPPRKIPNIWKPKSVSELKEILIEANRNRIPVYPISTGHNWGLGSKLPVSDASIIELKHLNEIVEVNEELSYARIQPGVTQLQLAEYLLENHPSLLLNVTGSDAHSSILGNALERGSGKNGQRVNDIRELKVLLSDGQEVRTGFGHPSPFYLHDIHLHFLSGQYRFVFHHPHQKMPSRYTDPTLTFFLF